MTMTVVVMEVFSEFKDSAWPLTASLACRIAAVGDINENLDIAG